MNRVVVPAFLLFVVSCVSISGGIPSLTAKEPVKCEVSIKEKSLKPSSSGTLLISLRPKKGIHINLKPPISITLDSTEALSKSGIPVIPKADTILNISKPIRLPITLSNSVKPGRLTVKGTIIYYGCSDAEGWCSRFKQPFEVAINVVQ